MSITDPPEFSTEFDASPLDAPLVDKRAWAQGAVTGVAGEPILFPDDSAINAAGSRATVAGSHNWVPAGPRNVGGRVTALAIHPTDPRIIYAGAASGGVHKTVDGGESWVALFHEQASLAVGAISICRIAPDTVWVATGEVRTGGAEVLRGDGIWLSTDAGHTWSNPATPHVPGAAPNQGFAFDAVAADPASADRCWAVGPAGVFRTLDRGVTWTLFANTAGAYFSDAVFTTAADGSVRLLLVKVRHFQDGGAVIIRIDNPAADNATTDALLREPFTPDPLPAHFMHIPFVGVVDEVGRGKLAVGVAAPGGAGAGQVAYVRFVTRDDPPDTPHSVHIGVWHCLDVLANPATSAVWRQLPDHPDWTFVGGDGQRLERQGTYNLSIAVNPKNPDHVVTGMVELYLSTNGRALSGAGAPVATWVRAMAFDLYTIDRAHHEDHHAAVFDPVADPPPLWVGNDGGASVSDDWHKVPVDSYPPRTGPVALPLPPNVIRWRKRSHGIAAAQMYDVGQSRLVPTLYGCGFQDNGVHVTSGGPTWRLVMPADGGFVAFDPDDPYRFFATWQEGIAHVEFPGRLSGTLPIPGDPVRQALWPRVVARGFLRSDTAPFDAETEYHPRDSGRVIHARLNRLYGMRRDRAADDWEVEPVGRSIELIGDPVGTPPVARLSVLPCAAGPKLGLEPQSDTRVLGFQTMVRSLRTGPYNLVPGDDLRLRVNGVDRTITFAVGHSIANLARASVAEVSAEIDRQLAVAPAVTGVRCRPAFWARPQEVEITTLAVSTAAAPASITVSGSALAPFNLAAGTYTGAIDHPAVVRLPVFDEVSRAFVNMGAGTAPPLRLTVQVGAGPARNLDFTAPPFADVNSLRAGELEQALSGALSADPARVEAVGVVRRLRLTAEPGATLLLDGTAAGRLGLVAVAANELMLPPDRDRLFLDEAPALRLRIRDGAHQRTIVFDATTGINDLNNVKPEELVRVIKAAIVDGALRIRADAWLVPRAGLCSEVAYSPYAPDRVWVGGTDGHLFTSTDDGARWTGVASPAMQAQDRRVEAIAFHPTQSDTVYVGLFGERKDLSVLSDGSGALGTGPNDPGFLFRTDDGGTRWGHVGAGVRDAGGNLVSINALATDPAAPTAVYAATNVGVFRSLNQGDDWAPFNEGLPNVHITDLVLEARTRMLRAGAWGRAVYERHVGDEAPRDVRLAVRANELDDGRGRPVLRGPHVFALNPESDPLSASPDIKLNRARPAHIGPDELIDGVEFDEEIDHEPPTPGSTTLFVQVHNRGAFPATDVRVVALWADVSSGPPPLPAGFWDSFAAGPLPEANGEWHRVADGPIAGGDGHDRVSASDPRVVSFPVVFPADVADMHRVGLVVMVSSPTDPLVQGELDIAKLIDGERRIAYRETPTVDAVDDGRLHLVGRSGIMASAFTLPAPVGESALGALGLVAAGPVTALTGGRQPFDLTTPATPRGLAVTLAPQTVTVEFVVADFPTLANTPAVVVQAILVREFMIGGVMVLARLTGAFNLAATAVRIEGRNGALVEVTGGTAAAPLGLPVGTGPAASVTTAAQTAVGFNLGGGNNTLQLTVTRSHTVRFDPTRLADPAAATAREVRTILNDDFTNLLFPVRAVVPRVELRVRRSVTDVSGPPGVTGGARLADLVVQGAQVPVADQVSLFRLVTVLGDDRVGATNFLYLRCHNTGDADQVDGRHRVFAVNIGASPHTITPIDGDRTSTVPAAGSVIVEFPWGPGPLTTGTPLVVLAVVDHPTDRPFSVPDTVASIDDLDQLCVTHPNAAYRLFVAS